MALRSTKDLKNMVKEQRAQSKMKGIAGQEYNTSGGSTRDEDDGENYEMQQKWDQKFGIENNHKGDKEKDQKAVIFKLERELDEMKQKFNQMRRNYDSMSNTAHTDKSQFAKIKQMKDQYEKTISILEAENKELKVEVEEQKPVIKDLEGQVKHWKAQFDIKVKELEKALADLKKQEKMFENRISGINKSNGGLLEANNKMKIEIQHLKLQVKEKQIQIDELVAQIKLMADADKQLSDMRANIAEKDRTILALRAQLDEALQAQRDLTDKYSNFEGEIEKMKLKYEQSLELSINLQVQIQQLEATNKSINAELAQSLSVNETQKGENEALIKKIEELNKTIDMLRNDSSASNGELVDKIRSLENDNSGLNAKLKTLQNQMSKLQGDHSTLKQEKSDLEKEIIEKDERESKLDQEIKDLKETIKELETKLFDNRKEFKEFQIQFEVLKAIELTFAAQIDKLNEKYKSTEAKMKLYEEQVEKHDKVRIEIQRALAKQTTATEELDSTLSCLSCLEYLKDPQTLVCGHSICRKCFTTHSDPNSKDSLVFCEECKIESKNKMIKEQAVMTLICEKYGTTRGTVSKIKELVEAK